MSVKFINIDKKEFLGHDFIFKYMPLERALQLLETKKLWFSNPSFWNDPFERRFIDGEYENGKRFTWQGRVYCMCTTSNSTSEASWKAYSGNDLAVQLMFDRKVYESILDCACIHSGISNVFLGRMDYQVTKDIIKSLSQIEFYDKKKLNLNSKEFKARLLLLKRKAFEYEDEFRAIIVKKDKSDAAGITVDIPNIAKLIKKITIGPTVGEEEFKMIKEHLMTKYFFTNKKIEKSNLYNYKHKYLIKN